MKLLSMIFGIWSHQMRHCAVWNQKTRNGKTLYSWCVDVVYDRNLLKITICQYYSDYYLDTNTLQKDDN